MESKKQKTDNNGNKMNKNVIILPKSYIGQEPIKITHHKRCRSLTDSLNELNNFDDEIEDNPFRCRTERKSKKVTFNKRIHIINIHNYKNENRILYYGNNNYEEEEEEKDKKGNKCLSCSIY